MEEIVNMNENIELNHVDMVATGKNIRKLCEEYCISKKQLMAVLNLTSVQAIDHYFSGNNLPSKDSLVIMSALFSTTIEDILILKGDSKGLSRNQIIEINDNNTVNNSLLSDHVRKCPIKNLKELGVIWDDMPEYFQDDIRHRIFDWLLRGGSVKDPYVQGQFEIAYKYANKYRIKETIEE